jgi:hypothetical protein
VRVLKQLTMSEKGVILLSALTLILGAANIGRAVLALRYSIRLPDLPMTISLRYFVAMGGFWGITFIVCAVGLSLFREWGRRCTLAVVTLYQMNVWANRLLFSASDYADQTIPRDVALTATLLLLFWIPLNLRQVKRTFKRGRERPPTY